MGKRRLRAADGRRGGRHSRRALGTERGIPAAAGRAAPAAGRAATALQARGGGAGCASDSMPTIVCFKPGGAGPGWFAASAAGGASRQTAARAAVWGADAGPGGAAAAGAALPGLPTMKACPHLGQRILSPVGGTRLSSIWYGALHDSHSTLSIGWSSVSRAYVATRFLPARLARYMALSAAWKSDSASAPSPGIAATPQLNPG